MSPICQHSKLTISEWLSNSRNITWHGNVLTEGIFKWKPVLEAFKLLECNLWLPLESWKGHDPLFGNHQCNDRLHRLRLLIPSASLMVTAGNNCWNMASEQKIIYQVLAQWLTWYCTWGSANTKATPCLPSMFVFAKGWPKPILLRTELPQFDEVGKKNFLAYK
jgi:hypothetical protein